MSGGHRHHHSDEKALVVEQLSTHFYPASGVIRAVSGLGFTLEQNRCLALIGESGAGKSVTALSLLRMVPPPGKIISGKVFLAGHDIMQMPLAALREIRGRELSIMFQDPLASFNPVMTIGAQLRQTIRAHNRISRREAAEIALDKLAAVKLPPNRVYRSYPFQLSGGMRQRAALSLALALHPRVLIADEPTTFLDVTLQRQILAELKRQLDECCLSILFITHDLAVAAAVADRVAVLYGGNLVECGPLPAVYRHPLHPYTRALLQSHPAFCQNGRLQPIDGTAFAAAVHTPGCVFHTRCPQAESICGKSVPNLQDVGEERVVACHHAAPSPEYDHEGVQ